MLFLCELHYLIFCSVCAASVHVLGDMVGPVNTAGLPDWLANAVDVVS